MSNAAFYISILSWILVVGLLVLVAAGKIATKTYYLIVHYTLTVLLALSTLICFAFTVIFLVDIFFLKKFWYPIWSILLMLPFTAIFGAMTRWSLILLKRARAL
jgi:hypothetical protein